MTLDPINLDKSLALATQWMPRAKWDIAYPEITEGVNTVGALKVAEIGAAISSDSDADAGSRMRDVARQLVTAATSTVDLAAFELRYCVTPSREAQADVRLYLLAKSYGNDSRAVTAVRSALVSAAMCFPSNFVATPVTMVPEILRVPDDSRVVELQRAEHITYPQWNFIPSDYYYHLDSITGDGSGWLPFSRAMSRSPLPLIVSILFKPTELDPLERDALGGTLTQLALYSHDHTDYNMLGYQDHYPADTNALISYNSWNQRVEQIAQRPILCRIAVVAREQVSYVYGAHLASALQLTRQKCINAIEIVTYDHLPSAEAAFIRTSVGCMEIWPADSVEMWRMDDAPKSLRRMQYLYGIEEASSVAILPVPDDQGVPGFIRAREDRRHRVTRYAEQSIGDSISLGAFVHYGDATHAAELPLKALNRHTLVVGVTGFGKTTTVMTILAQLWRDHRVPWAVIEPTRPEYRLMCDVAGVEELKIFSLGRDDISPIRINPLQPPRGIRCATHISSLLSIFKLALPLLPPLPELLGPALDRTYLLYGWDYDTRIEDGIPPPSLRDLLSAFTEVFEEAAYTGEARNVGAAFTVRLRSLLSGGRGRILDTVESTDIAALMDGPVVFEMRDIEDAEDKAFLAALILQYVRAKAVSRGLGDGRLHHLTVIEEAHRILPAEVSAATESGQQTRARATEEFVNAIAELRSLGEGFIVCSQKPTRLAKAAIGNTNTRIVHHLTDSDDREMMTRDMAASDADHENASRLRVGECLVRWLPLDHPELVCVVPSAGIDTASIPTDSEIAERMRLTAEQTRALLPYALCTRKVCRTGCDVSIRTAGRALELRTRISRRSAHLAAVPNLTFEKYVGNVAEAFAMKHDGQPTVTYCALVHSLLEVEDSDVLGLNSHEVDDRRDIMRRRVEAAHGNP